MSFVQLFHQSNFSLNSFRGNIIHCSPEYTRGNMVFLETGLKRSTICFETELTIQEKDLATKRSKLPDNQSFVGIENIDFFGEPKLVLPKALQQIWKRKLVWAELTKVWRGRHNRIRGFILNQVNGGYAVAIAGHIAFLPKSLKTTSKVFHGQSRLFSILNMNSKIKNIVVKELPLGQKMRSPSNKGTVLSAGTPSKLFRISSKEERKLKLQSKTWVRSGKI